MRRCKGMRDAAGDAGEFYTPRPVVRFMVEAMNPKIGEVVLDPACGTGGFLVEAFNYLGSSAILSRIARCCSVRAFSGAKATAVPVGANEFASARAREPAD